MTLSAAAKHNKIAMEGAGELNFPSFTFISLLSQAINFHLRVTLTTMNDEDEVWITQKNISQAQENSKTIFFIVSQAKDYKQWKMLDALFAFNLMNNLHSLSHRRRW